MTTGGRDVLRVGAALPDPPFELPSGDGVAGFDPAMMRAVAAHLGRELEVVRYAGGDFDGIFAGLADGRWDVVASGATVTDHRRTLARFCRPYLRSGQSLVVAADGGRSGLDDLVDGRLGVQRGNTSEPVAVQLLAAGRVGAVQHYDYDDIEVALDDVEAGRIDGFMKLEPVLRWFARDRPRLRVVQTGITVEEIAVAVGTADAALATAVDGALDAMRADGSLAAIGARWLPADVDATTVVTS